MRNNSRRGRFRRGIYVLPTLFTIGTIFCGFYAVTSALKGEFNLAAIAIGFAVVFDGLDGRIARMTNSCSEFGVQIDSLADVVTFGWLRQFWPISGGCGLFLRSRPILFTCNRSAGSSASVSWCAGPCVWRGTTSRAQNRRRREVNRRSPSSACRFLQARP